MRGVAGELGKNVGTLSSHHHKREGRELIFQVMMVIIRDPNLSIPPWQQFSLKVFSFLFFFLTYTKTKRFPSCASKPNQCSLHNKPPRDIYLIFN